MHETHRHTTDRHRLPGFQRIMAAIGVAAASLLGLGAASLLAAGSASANSSGCDNFHNVCIEVHGDAGGTVTITGYPESTPFDGTMTLTGPGGYSSTTPDQSWNIGDPDNFTSSTSYTWTLTSTWSGEYCVSGYDTDNSTNEGMACETVS